MEPSLEKVRASGTAWALVGGVVVEVEEEEDKEEGTPVSWWTAATLYRGG
jgi:hypothetical protein